VTDIETNEETLPTHATWIPTTIRDIEYALGVIGAVEAEVAEFTAQAEAARAVIASRESAFLYKAHNRMEYLRVAVLDWAKANRDQVVRGKLKSRELLSGTISFRSTGERVVVTDADALIAWAQEKHLDLLDYKPRIDKKALDAFVLTTGEVPPGVDVTAPIETVTLKTNPLPTLTAGTKELP